MTVPTGQWVTVGDGHRWWFDSGSAAIDLAYTGVLGGTVEQLQDSSALGEWLGGRFDIAPTTDRDLTDALALRSAIAQCAASVSQGSDPAGADVDVLNLFAALPDIPPVLAGGQRQAGRGQARPGQALSAIARDASAIFSTGRTRIRECAAVDCHMIFYDDSRSNNRRWCSMQRCGNRSKVRAHRARTSSPAIP